MHQNTTCCDEKTHQHNVHYCTEVNKQQLPGGDLWCWGGSAISVTPETPSTIWRLQKGEDCLPFVFTATSALSGMLLCALWTLSSGKWEHSLRRIAPQLAQSAVGRLLPPTSTQGRVLLPITSRLWFSWRHKPTRSMSFWSRVQILLLTVMFVYFFKLSVA